MSTHSVSRRTTRIVIGASIVAIFGVACSGGTTRSAHEPSPPARTAILAPIVENVTVDAVPDVVSTAFEGNVIATHRLRSGEFAFPKGCDDGTNMARKRAALDGWLTPLGLSAVDTRARVKYRCDLLWSGTKAVVCSQGQERFSTAAETQQAGGDYQLCLGTDPPVAFVSIANIPPAAWIGVKQGASWMVLSAKGIDVVRVPVVEDASNLGAVQLTVRWVSDQGDMLDERTVNTQAAG